MADKPKDRGVADSIAALREMRYMTRGPGQFERKRAKAAPAPSIAKLRNDVAKVAKKAAKKKPKKGSRR